MNREIKFRFWVTDVKHMVSWESVIKYHSLEQHLLSNGLYIPLQYTGLKDKNGKEIYEGDIVKSGISGLVGIIEFKNFAFQIRTVNKEQEDWGGYLHWFENNHLEIIGNIYENPELVPG